MGLEYLTVPLHCEACDPDGGVRRRPDQLLAEGQDEVLGGLLSRHQRQHGDDAVEHLPDLVGVAGGGAALLEAGVAHGDDLVQVVLDALGGHLARDLGA